MMRNSTEDFENIKCQNDYGVEICFTNEVSDTFEESTQYFSIKNENTDDLYLSLNESCINVTTKCLSNNIVIAAKYLIIFIIAIFSTHFAHEIFHFTVFWLSGEKTSGFLITIGGGSTAVELPDASSHGVLWWYVALMGPLLFVNTTIMVIALLKYRTNSSEKVIFNETSLSRRYGEIFLKASGYVSATSILLNTIFSPIIEWFAKFYNFEMHSDLVMAWHESLLMVGGPQITMQILCIVTTAMMITLAFYYMFLIGNTKN